MPSQNRLKVAKKLIAALEKEGYSPNCHVQRSVEYVAENIWVASGGATKLDVARWGIEMPCLLINPPADMLDKQSDIVPVCVGSWLTLAQAAKGETLVLIRHDHRHFEA